MQDTVGFIGLGIMGAPMAANLLRAGHALTVHNRTPDKAAPLLAAGATTAPSPAALARTADTIVLMLTGPQAIDAVLAGDAGLLAADLAGKRIINMGTVPPAYAVALGKRLASHGAVLIDAPVSGSKAPAEAGTLLVLAGGEAAAIDAVEPVLLAMGKAVLRCGPIGTGSAMKMAVNLLLATMMAGLAEAVNLGEKSGLDTALLLDTVLAGPLGCGLFAMKRDMLVQGAYPAQFPLRHMAKDLGFIMQAAQDAGAPLPLGKTVAGLYAGGPEDEDFAAVKRVFEWMA
jgi:3-hydroxyisobutyrate dehydrogenase-like beta-hydroxyacid dehydrogenase